MNDKNDCNKLVVVKINDDKIRDIIRKVVQDKIEDLANKTSVYLDNHDYTWRPAAWWEDRAQTKRRSHGRSHAAFTYDRARNTVVISAQFVVSKI